MKEPIIVSWGLRNPKENNLLPLCCPVGRANSQPVYINNNQEDKKSIHSGLIYCLEFTVWNVSLSVTLAWVSLRRWEMWPSWNDDMRSDLDASVGNCLCKQTQELARGTERWHNLPKVTQLVGIQIHDREELQAIHSRIVLSLCIAKGVTQRPEGQKPPRWTSRRSRLRVAIPRRTQDVGRVRKSVKKGS